MKKSFKPLIVVISSLLVLITILLLISQGLRLKYEELQRELAQLEKQIKTEKTQMINLSANYQMLTAEDAIKPYALNELALVVADSDSINKITLNKGDLVKLTESLKDRHE
jgi:cell division protein FtsB